MEAGVFGPGLCSPDSSRGKCPRSAFTHKKTVAAANGPRLPLLPSRSRADTATTHSVHDRWSADASARSGSEQLELEGSSNQHAKDTHMPADPTGARFLRSSGGR